MVAVIGVVLAWRASDRAGRCSPALAVAAGSLARTSATSSPSNLGWIGMCVIGGWVAFDVGDRRGPSAAGAVLVAVARRRVARGPAPSRAGAPGSSGISFTTIGVHCSAAGCGSRSTQLRAAQDELAERSRAEERTRIAGEMHDVIGHALTVSLLHVSSARLALDEDPQEARRALSEAERLARDEPRRGARHRRPDAHRPPERPDARCPASDDLPALVESFRRAGADVELAASTTSSARSARPAGSRSTGSCRRR